MERNFQSSLEMSFSLGLGNAFLSHIKACDGIFHMVRIFDEPDIIHVEGNVDPIRDIEIIHDELRLKDLEMAKKVGDDLEKKAVRGNDKTLKTDHVRLFILLYRSSIKHL